MTDDDNRRAMIALYPRMRRFAMSLARSSAEADDLVQATYERAIRSLDRFQSGTRLDSWMYRIMQNLHRNQIRNARTRDKYLVGDSDPVDGAFDGLRAAHAQLEFADISRLVAMLDEDHRTVLMLVAVEGHGYQEVADMLQIPIGTVTSRLARARLKLRAWMEAASGAPSRGSKAVGGLS